ncbi:MAG: PDZ domain-containing protein [Paraburkholderia fungorum]|jgi:hypothetical protein|nr:PDZ domain-containing protein [Paraburkholderia fungorum]
MKRGFLLVAILWMSLFAAREGFAQEAAVRPLYTSVPHLHTGDVRYDSPILTIRDSGLAAGQGIVKAQLTLFQSPQGEDEALGLAVAFYTEGKWNFNTARDYGKFGVRYEQNQVPVLIPTLNGDGYGNPDDWSPLADGGKAWPMKGGVFVMLDRIYLKAYEISGTDFVLTLSDYNAVDKVFKIRIPAAFLSSFLASIPNDRRLVPQSLSNSPSTFGVQYAVLNESAKAEMKIPGDAMRVMGILPGKIADRAGLKNFDVLLRFGDQPLKQTQDLSDAVHAVSKGATVPLTVWRDAKEVRLQAQF